MLRREGMHFFLLFTLTACTAAAVGPVMNDSPPTVYDQIKNRTDLTEVNELNFFFSSFSSSCSSLFVLFGVFVFFCRSLWLIQWLNANCHMGGDVRNKSGANWQRKRENAPEALALPTARVWP